MLIKIFILKIFKIELIELSLEIIYKRNNVYYPTLSKAIFEIKDDKFNKNIKKRLELGDWSSDVCSSDLIRRKQMVRRSNRKKFCRRT